MLALAEEHQLFDPESLIRRSEDDLTPRARVGTDHDQKGDMVVFCLVL
jgi:hypothetical protein